MPYSGLIDAVLVGTAQPLARGLESGIRKRPVAGPVAIGATGLSGDVQVDTRVHGGTERAIHYYPAEHYAAWQEERPDLFSQMVPGGFGENLSASGVTEQAACVGDVWRIGTALLEITQGRQPCWKLDARFGTAGILEAVLRSGRGGWYFGVIETGVVLAGAPMMLVDRPNPAWSVHQVTRALLCKEGSATDYQAIAVLPALTSDWRQRALNLAEAASRKALERA